MAPHDDPREQHLDEPAEYPLAAGVFDENEFMERAHAEMRGNVIRDYQVGSISRLLLHLTLGYEWETEQDRVNAARRALFALVREKGDEATRQKYDEERVFELLRY